ncbi:MAG: type II toxin-antitoxin system RelE/ParE family toxin [Flavobacteriales bacterium]
MSFDIRWSARARQDYFNILEYLIEEWGIGSARKFDKKLQKAVSSIQDNPLQFPASDRMPNIRRCVVVKQCSLYYRINGQLIELITLFDTRQHPRKRRLK